MRTKCLNKVKRTEVIKEMKMLYTPFKKDSRMLKKNKQNERAVKIILVFDLPTTTLLLFFFHSHQPINILTTLQDLA